MVSAVRYYVQHGAGLGALVSEALAEEFPDGDSLFEDDSGLVFECAAPADRVARLPYVRNAFEVLDTAPRSDAIGVAAEEFARRAKRGEIRLDLLRGNAFRTMASIDGQLTGLPERARERLESAIQARGGRLNPRGGSGVEYWIVGRRELNLVMFCRKLTSGRQKTGPRGSLGADLAMLLVRESLPRPDDVFLDPFAGSGALVAARLGWPYGEIIGSDLRGVRLAVGPGDLGRLRLLADDALRLPSISDGQVSAIVTDPPWGEHETLDLGYADFAAAMLAGFDRVLDPRAGRLVLLLSRQTAGTVEAEWKRARLRVRAAHDILVNGHPATVLAGGR
jgi:hypothetical protein